MNNNTDKNRNIYNNLENLKQLAIELELFQEVAKEKFLEYYKDKKIYNKEEYKLDIDYLLDNLNNSILNFKYIDNEGDEWTIELPLEWFLEGKKTKPAKTFLNGWAQKDSNNQQGENNE